MCGKGRRVGAAWQISLGRAVWERKKGWRRKTGRIGGVLGGVSRFGGLTECLISGVLGEYRRFGPASRGGQGELTVARCLAG